MKATTKLAAGLGVALVAGVAGRQGLRKHQAPPPPAPRLPALAAASLTAKRAHTNVPNPMVRFQAVIDPLPVMSALVDGKTGKVLGYVPAPTNAFTLLWHFRGGLNGGDYTVTTPYPLGTNLAEMDLPATNPALLLLSVTNGYRLN